MKEAAECGLNLWIWLPALRGGWDPVDIAEQWTVPETVDAVRALLFRDVLEWSKQPKQKPRGGKHG